MARSPGHFTTFRHSTRRAGEMFTPADDLECSFSGLNGGQ
jgi:hypothetical protein